MVPGTISGSIKDVLMEPELVPGTIYDRAGTIYGRYAVPMARLESSGLD
jgi:hypothetical protein